MIAMGKNRLGLKVSPGPDSHGDQKNLGGFYEKKGGLRLEKFWKEGGVVTSTVTLGRI